MIDFLGAVVVAFGVVFVAELGDKTQVLALGYGAQYPLRIVAAGLTLGYAAAGLIATIVGGVLGAALPERPIQIVSGLIFLVFAARSVRSALSSDADDDAVPHEGQHDAPVLHTAGRATIVGSIALTIAIAEMGDKTQITTATLASQSAPLGVWIGATVGAASSGMIGAVAGRSIGHRISTRAIEVTSAAIFAGFGVAMLMGWF